MWRWILGVILLLLVLLLWTRVGVWAALDRDKVLRLDARFGLFRIHVLPAKPRKPKAEEKPPKPKKPKREKPPKEAAPEKGTLSFALEDLRDALDTVLPALSRALRRLGRGIQIKPLRLSLVLGGLEDPAAAAETYGKLQAAAWTGMPLLEQLLDIRDPYIHTDVDFQAKDTAVEGEAGITLRIGTLLAMGFGVAFPALGWFLRWRKRCKTRPPKPEKKPPENPEPEEPKPENPAA